MSQSQCALFKIQQESYPCIVLKTWLFELRVTLNFRKVGWCSPLLKHRNTQQKAKNVMAQIFLLYVQTHIYNHLTPTDRLIPYHTKLGGADQHYNQLKYCHLTSENLSPTPLPAAF